MTTRNLNAIDTNFYGVRYIYSEGIELDQYPSINFINAIITPDDVNNWISVTLSDPVVNNATPNAEPDTLALRDGGGGCSFISLESTSIECSTLNSTTAVTCVDLTSTGTLTTNVFNPLILTSADITAISGSKYKLSSRSITRSMPAPWINNYINDTTTWNFQDQRIIQTQIIDSPIAKSVLVPHGCTITNIKVYLKGASGHSNANIISMTKPLFGLRQINKDGSTNFLSTTFDSPLSAIAYQAAHYIDSGIISIPIDRENHSYSIYFQGEYGAGALIGLNVLDVFVTYTVTEMSDGF